MPLTPLFTSLTAVLVTRTLLIPFDRRAQAALRALLVVVLQAAFAVLPVADAANWWIVAAAVAAVDLAHAVLVGLLRDRLPLAHFLSFILAAMLLTAVAAAPGLVPSYNPVVNVIAAGLTGGNRVLASLTPQTFHFLAVTACGLWISGVEANNPIALMIKRSKLMPRSVVRSATEPARGRIIGILMKTAVS